MTDSRGDERSREEQTSGDERSREEQTVCAVVVTHRRLDELAKSLNAVSAQTRAPDHLVVVDNDDDPRVRDIVSGQPIPTTYLGSRRNLGGAGGFALGMLHALALGADWIWLADDDGRPVDSEVLGKLLACAQKSDLAEVSPMVCDMNNPERLAFPLRRGLLWRRRVSELRTEGRAQDLLPGIASLFNGALFRASTLEAVGVPDLRLFMRGDEVEVHRRLVRSGLPFGTCLTRCICIRKVATSSSRSWAEGCTPNTPTTPGSGSSPTAIAAICCRSPACGNCCHRNGYGSAGSSWCLAVIRPG